MGKKVFLGIVLLFVAGSLVFAGGAKEAERTKLIAAADISYPPFEYMEGDRKSVV